MAAVQKEVADLAKSFEDDVFNNEDILTCVISGVKYAEVVGAIEFIACTTFEKAQSTWHRIKDEHVQECKTYFFGFEPGMKNATVANLDTLIKIAFTLKGPWATAFQGASAKAFVAKALMAKKDPMMELIEALGATVVNDAVPETDVDRSHYLYLRLCRPDKFRIMDAPPRVLNVTNVRFGTCKSVADKHDEIIAVAPDNGFMAMSIRLANGEEAEQLEDIVVSMVRDNRFYEYDGNNKFASVENMSYFYGIGEYDWEAFDYEAYRRVVSAFAQDIWEACSEKFPNAVRKNYQIPGNPV